MTFEKWYCWTNHETMLAQQWICMDKKNDENIKWYAKNRKTIEKDPELAEAAVAGYIRTLVNNNMPNLGATLYAELLNDSLAKIDFYQIARDYINHA